MGFHSKRRRLFLLADMSWIRIKTPWEIRVGEELYRAEVSERKERNFRSLSSEKGIQYQSLWRDSLRKNGEDFLRTSERKEHEESKNG